MNLNFDLIFDKNQIKLCFNKPIKKINQNQWNRVYNNTRRLFHQIELRIDMYNNASVVYTRHFYTRSMWRTKDVDIANTLAFIPPARLSVQRVCLFVFSPNGRTSMLSLRLQTPWTEQILSYFCLIFRNSLLKIKKFVYFHNSFKRNLLLCRVPSNGSRGIISMSVSLYRDYERRKHFWTRGFHILFSNCLTSIITRRIRKPNIYFEIVYR